MQTYQILKLKKTADRNFAWTLLLFVVLIFSGCTSEPTAEKEKIVDSSKTTGPAIQSVDLANGVKASDKLFTQLSGEETGIEFQNFLKDENRREYLLNGAGITSGDIDNDGLVDLFCVSQDGKNKLFRQTEPWKFEDISRVAGVEGTDAWDGGTSFADVNNDGFLDLYVCVTNGNNQLYINDGQGKFSEQAKSWGVDHGGASTMCAFCDYDNDGDLDLYLLNNRLFRPEEEAQDVKIIETRSGEKKIHPDFAEHFFFIDGHLSRAGQRDILYRNDGDKFTDVTNSAGITGFDMGLSATWWDFNADGLMDLYVANDLKTPDHLYQNLGDGKFKDVIADVATHTPWFSMGADAGDINNDGRMDFLVADMSSTTHYKQKTTMGEMGNSAWFLTMGTPRQFMRNTLLLNSGAKHFWEGAGLTGLDSTDWTWAVRFFDCDCDGKLDVFFANGYGKNINDSDHQAQVKALQKAGKETEAAKLAQSVEPLKEENLLFKNLGDLKFKNVSADWGANHVGVSNSCTTVDIDRDGDLDLIVSNLNEQLSIYRNDSSNGNRVLIQLRGQDNNHFGIGSEVTLRSKSGTQIRQLSLSRGYMSSNEALIHFGLGNDQSIDELTVKWPGGGKQVFSDLAVGKLYTITEQETSSAESTVNSDSLVFHRPESSLGLEFKHEELPYDDFSRQPLLPNKLSQLGPGIAWGDVNSDGFPDCYVAGARGQSGMMFVQKDGKFEIQKGPWAGKQLPEEMGCLFFDFDADGDEDLYVVTGGYEFEPENENYADFLYLNDGSGAFSVATKEALPDLKDSGSCVSSCDFDRDGDLDLFVGTRMIPHQWPLNSTSRLLVNQGGKFVEADANVAGPLNDIGLVTSSIWSDFDNDGWIDLLLATEWGPIRVLKNDKGRLTDASESTGTDRYLGWWNSISGGDFDRDGDTDYVVMNTGLNTKYHASPEHPVTLYAHDFDDNGRFDLVESEWEGDKCFPIRGKSCSTHAIPLLGEKFETYHQFAIAELDEIYGDDLKDAKTFEVSNLKSGIFINNGNGQLKFQPLPRLAQISPGFGTCIQDFDSDGLLDVLIGQNFMQPQPETGQMDGGLGLLLKGDGKGNFKVVETKESGIVIAGQAMAVSSVDLNADRRPDTVVTVNDEPLVVYQNQNSGGTKPLCLQLIGSPGNPRGFGAKIVVSPSSEESKQLYEMTAGSGYLTQSQSIIFLSLDPADTWEATITWPDGKIQNQTIDPEADLIKIFKKDINAR